MNSDEVAMESVREGGRNTDGSVQSELFKRVYSSIFMDGTFNGDAKYGSGR